MSELWTSICSESELEDLISDRNQHQRSPILILKHSTRCAFSSMAKSRLQSKPDARLNYFIIDVIKDRAISNRLAELTHIQHESPQSFLFSNGKLIQNDSHISIKASKISAELDSIS